MFIHISCIQDARDITVNFQPCNQVMSELVTMSVLLINIAVSIILLVDAQPVKLSPHVHVIESGNGQEVCLSSDTLESTYNSIKEEILQLIQDAPCGGLGWRQVVSLDLGDPSQQCPSPWIETATPERSCFAQNNFNCIGVSFPVSGTYNHVCGRAVGHGLVSPDAFANIVQQNSGIDGPYLDGIVVTHGSPRQHIWSFGVGHGGTFRCPCDNVNRVQAPFPPSFVGDNYFCDGDYNGALWDGLDCTTACCTFNSPPWFTVTLPTTASNDIEVRICSDEPVAIEATHLRSLQLYVK